MKAHYIDLDRLASSGVASELQNALSENPSIASDLSLLRVAIDAGNQDNALLLLKHWDNSCNNHRAKSDLYIKAVVKQLHQLVELFNSDFSINIDIQLRAFRAAISNNDKQMVEVLLEHSPLCHYDPKRLPIEGLGESGDDELIRYLSKKGVDLDYCNGQPLIGAVLAGNTRAIRQLAESGADLYIADNLALKHAALAGTDDCLKLLFDLTDSVDKHGAYFDTKMWATSTACLEAILAYQVINAISQLEDEAKQIKINLGDILKIPTPKTDFKP